MIISVHIPKCGGISFEHVLKSVFGSKRVWLSYHGDREAIPPGIECIHGHFPSDTFDGIVPHQELVTWLRHPVERVASNFHHFLRHPDATNPWCRRLLDERLSLEAFAALDGLRNEATRYLAGKPLDAFKFVGITERFRESLSVFGETFGVSISRRPPHENANTGRTTPHYPISARTYDHILALNLDDLAAYDMAASRLELQLAQADAERQTASSGRRLVRLPLRSLWESCRGIGTTAAGR